MMQVLRFVLEWVLCYLAIWGLFWGAIKLFSTKWNPITAVIFSFMVVGMGVFLTFSYFLKSVAPSYIYMPILIFWFIYYLYWANRKMSQ